MSQDIENANEDGKPSTGARAYAPLRLMRLQEQVIQRILRDVRGMCEELKDTPRPSEDKKEKAERRFERPRNVYLVDGARGSGKTSTLLSLHKYLTASREVLPEKDAESLEGLHAMSKKVGGLEQLAKPGHRPLVLPLINTSDIEPDQAAMEALIANVEILLSELEAEAQRTHNDADLRVIEKLKNQLRLKVAKGWYLTRPEGRQSLLNEASGFDSFVKRMSQESAGLHERVQAWRDLVQELLHFQKSSCMIVTFDDADLNPEVTAEIVHTIRVFLDHPNIVTVFAGNLRTIRNVLTVRNFRTLHEAIQSLGETEREIAADWHRVESHQIEEYLEKVLPRQKRAFLRIEPEPLLGPRTKNRDVDGAGGNGTGEGGEETDSKDKKDDFERVLAVSFDQFAHNMSRRYRRRFVRAKLKSHQNWIENDPEVDSINHQRDMENFVSWWLYRHRYGDALRPQSLRQLLVMRDFFGQMSADIDNPNKPPPDPAELRSDKRLVLVLFESPSNTPLLKRITDSDQNLLHWMSGQETSSNWIGNRSLTVGGTKFPEGDYSYDYLRFRIDLGIAMPVQVNRSLVIPRDFLPTPSGPDLNGWGGFYPGIEHGSYFGVNSVLKHSAIPANCNYMWDLSCLPDVAWQEDEVDGLKWVWKLPRKWPELFYRQRRRTHRTPFLDLTLSGPLANAASALNELRELQEEDSGFGQDVGFRRDGYFVDVVLPLASVDAASLIARTSKTSVRPASENGKLLSDREVRAEQAPFYEGLRKKIAARQYDIGGDFKQLRPDSDRWNCQVAARAVLREAAKKSYGGDAVHDLVCYQMLVNDLKKAWSSFRILLNQLPEAVKGHGVYKDRFEGRVTEQSPDDWYAASARRKDLFSRDDLFLTHLPIQYILERWFGPAEALLVSLRRCAPEVVPDLGGHKLTAEQYMVTRISSRQSKFKASVKVFSGGDDVLSREALTSWSKAESSLIQTEGGEEPMWRGVARELLSSQYAEEAVTDADKAKRNAEIMEAANMARVMRSFLLFTYAFVPTLPSLIHLEVMNEIYEDNRLEPDNEEAAVRIGAIKKTWGEFLKSLLTFVQWFEDYLEYMKLRLDCDPSDEKLGGASELVAVNAIRLTTVPDIAFSSMGVSGLTGHGVKVERGKEPEFVDLNDEKARKRLVQDSMTIWGESILGRTQLNLLACMRFLDQLQVEPIRRGSNSEAKDGSG